MPKQKIHEMDRRPSQLYWSSSQCLLLKAGGILAHSKLGSFIVDMNDPQLLKSSAVENAKSTISEFCKRKACPLFTDCMHRAAGVTLKTEPSFVFPAVQVF